MNIAKLNKVADKMIRECGQYFAYDIKRTDPEKVIGKLYKGLNLPKDDKELLDVIIKLRMDCGVSSMRAVVTDVIQRELRPLKDDIKRIKGVVGCNGE